MNAATRMKDAGRSWTEIADALNVSVRDAKAAVREDKLKRREALSQTQIAEDRNGLRDECICGHERKLHADKAGACSVCVEEPCEEFEQPVPFTDRWWRRRGIDHYGDKRGHYVSTRPEKELVDPDIQLSKRVSVAAWQLGLPWDSKGESPVPHPSLVVKLRRAKKRLAAGKPVYKSRDRARFR